MTKKKNIFKRFFACLFALAVFALPFLTSLKSLSTVAEESSSDADYYNEYIDSVVTNYFDNEPVSDLDLQSAAYTDWIEIGTYTATASERMYIIGFGVMYSLSLSTDMPQWQMQYSIDGSAFNKWVGINSGQYVLMSNYETLSFKYLDVVEGSTYVFRVRLRGDADLPNNVVPYFWLSQATQVNGMANMRALYAFSDYKVAYQRGVVTGEDIGYLRGYLDGYDKALNDSSLNVSSFAGTATIAISEFESVDLDVTFDDTGMYFYNFPSSAWLSTYTGCYEIAITFDNYYTPYTLGLTNGLLRVGVTTIPAVVYDNAFISSPNVFLYSPLATSDTGRGDLLFAAPIDNLANYTNELYMRYGSVNANGIDVSAVRSKTLILQCPDYNVLKSLYLFRDKRAMQELDKTYKDGYNSGYTNGNRDGYNRGYNAGLQGSDHTFFGLISAIVEAPVKTFTSLFDFDVLGYNMAQFMKNIFTVMVFVFVVKWVISI